MLRTIYEKAVFVDTGAFVALLNPSDKLHNVASRCLKRLREEKLPLYISNITIVETHKRVLFDIGYNGALAFLCHAYGGLYNIVRLIEADEYEGRRIIENFSDQDFTLADTINFSIMKRYGIGKAFAFDIHFSTFGFERIPF